MAEPKDIRPSPAARVFFNVLEWTDETLVSAWAVSGAFMKCGVNSRTKGRAGKEYRILRESMRRYALARGELLSKDRPDFD